MTTKIAMNFDIQLIQDFLAANARHRFLSNKVWNDFATKKEDEEYSDLTDRINILQSQLEGSIIEQMPPELMPELVFKIDISKMPFKLRKKLQNSIDLEAEMLEDSGTAEMAALSIACENHGIELDEYYVL